MWVRFSTDKREPLFTTPSARSSNMTLKQHVEWGSSLPKPTSLTGIVHQDDFRKQAVRRAIYNAVHGPKQSTPCFVVKHNNYTCVGEFIGVDFCLATAKKHRKKKPQQNKNRRKEGLILKKILKSSSNGTAWKTSLSSRIHFKLVTDLFRLPSQKPKGKGNFKSSFPAKKRLQGIQRNAYCCVQSSLRLQLSSVLLGMPRNQHPAASASTCPDIVNRKPLAARRIQGN